jgi:hypothetical protein
MGYKELDDAIKSHIEQRPGKHPIYSAQLLHMAAVELGRDAYRGDDKEWRLIDRRLQALKKAGQVQHLRQPARWVLCAA